ncbi:hypothetical protein STRZYGA_00640 [Brevundimonas phage vB_BpoS-Strzyga]|nr:hypothetical protein STRZYGA_00640 [Brevundimonas phage vB_BpoS-Strzyga]
MPQQPAPTLPPIASPESNPDAHRPLAWGGYLERLPLFRNRPGSAEKFKARVWWIADTLTKYQGRLFDANDLMACMSFESAGTFDSKTKNPKSSATGLIQFMLTTARDVLKIDHSKLAKMTPEDQLNEVYKYFKWVIDTFGPVSGTADTYMAIFRPATVGKPSETPLFIKGTDAYAVNTGLDVNKDGRILKAEAASKIIERLALGLRPENIG